MLQVDMRHYASDALEEAMTLAQTKALNSYTFSDCMNFLNYAWRDIYDRIAMVDDGYYGINVRLTDVITKLPPFVKNTVSVYQAQSPVGYNRTVYKNADNLELTSPCIYKISGTDLYCPDAKRRTVWLYYVPACTQIFFTHHNRDPKMYENMIDAHGDTIWGKETVRCKDYNISQLIGYDENDTAIDITSATDTQLGQVVKWIMHNRATNADDDLTELLIQEDEHWKISYISCDFPYIFVTYTNDITNKHLSGFIDTEQQFNEYNPFAFTGRDSNIEYVECHWNDKTGMGVVIKDYNDLDENNLPRIKELGWTPDTLLNYPIPEMYRYLVARLADKLSALNESNVMGVQKELAEAKFAFEAFLDRDKASWKRITNVNPPTIADYL